MRIVFFTRDGYSANPLFTYLFAHVATVFPDSHIVAVKAAQTRGIARRMRRLRTVFRQRGVAGTLDILSSKPFQWWIGRRDGASLDQALNSLSRPVAPQPASVSVVTTINGRDAIETLKDLRPDILIQAGAGILRSEIFSIPTVCALNLHHGIAPRIRGVNSIYWGLYENREDWIGSTVHRIDAGIDTGRVLAHAPVERQVGEGFPSLFARATEAGVAQLLSVLSRLQAGEEWSVPVNGVPSEYRSSISGWRLLLVELKLWRERRRRDKLPVHPSIRTHLL
jgi:hypothetical protein